MRDVPGLRGPKILPSGNLEWDLWLGWAIELVGPVDNPSDLTAIHIVTGQMLVWRPPYTKAHTHSSLVSWFQDLEALTG